MFWFNFDIYIYSNNFIVSDKKKIIKIVFWGKFMIELYDLNIII